MGHHARAPEVWELHAAGLTVRAIAERLGMGKSTVQRILDQGRQDAAPAFEAQAMHLLEKQAGAAGQVVDIATWITQTALEDHADSLRVAQLLEGAGDLQGLAFERRERSRHLQLLAKVHGVEPLRREALELQRKAATGEQTLPGIIAALKLDQADLPIAMPAELARWLSPPEAEP